MSISLKSEAVRILEAAGLKDAEKTIEIPPQPEFGDVASTICFELAKKEYRNPSIIAKDIMERVRVPEGSLVLKVGSKAGYINFFFNWNKLSEIVLKEIRKGVKIDVGKNEKVMVEYSQPNPVHPMHVGHARSTLLGDSLANIYEFLGFKTIRANYMNDTGLQVAKLVTAYMLWANGKKPEGKPDLWLWEYYVRFHEETLKDPTLEEKARETLRKFEIDRDEKTMKIWNRVVKWCVEGFEKTYRKLGIAFNVYLYESNFRPLGKINVEKLIAAKYAHKNEEGVVVADLSKFGIADTIILRSDGTGLYHTSDLGMTPYKFEKYKLDRAVWVVSTEQNLYFKQLFKMLELLGYVWVKNCHHFSFELVRLPEGKMSSREGRAVMLDEAIKTLVKLAYDEVEKRNKEIKEKEKLKLAEEIGVGALKYAITKIEPNKLITFDWKRMLSFEGDTGPYLQYAHTRCNGILKRAGRWKPSLKPEKITEQEKELIKILARFSETVESAGKDLKPHYICSYAYNLATAFDKFYEVCPVLKAESEDLKNFRLTLVDATKSVLKDALSLIGIQTPEKM